MSVGRTLTPRQHETAESEPLEVHRGAAEAAISILLRSEVYRDCILVSREPFDHAARQQSRALVILC